ncbi:adenosylcobinamide-GDP ribazoletransferase [Corynebacterium crudilactis]|uniref:Adenosylcobinamide-GDP ribazoletransferase n=1 Tax=Corynebacterium crudilactis TaxID=1652495 RepID=A0A172QUW7_9CORY|nr:adenosylcobinamide-GDP ribazoletransferase [Corynebacterium crudilactis]ANE04441.1 adenosylcobinamide-GDP ribazoletransferase [Corynebacterium crudilactis]
MSGKAGFSPSHSDDRHGFAPVEGICTALNWMSILPIPGATVFDRLTGARVMAALPIVGLVFGMCTALLLAAIGPISGALSADALLVAVLIVAMWELLNRFMHLDGLADVADALGSYAAPPRAREILADPHTGLFGFSAAIFSILIQVTAVASLINSPAWWTVCFIPLIARLTGQVTALQHHSPFSPTGFGALVIGTVKWWWVVLWWLGISALAFVFSSLGNSLWLGLGISITAIVSCCCAELFTRHLSKRFGGVNGDCIGACIHLGAAIAAVVLAVLAEI